MLIVAAFKGFYQIYSLYTTELISEVVMKKRVQTEKKIAGEYVRRKSLNK